MEGEYGSCPFMFQGQYYDKEINLAYNHFRCYDPEDDRCISVDLLRSDGYNL
ncbi:RHS repeat-associated core domain-containing protein [Tenacibaculum sp.]|uniref:RHS repeat-associated core domain-containing protein n=1 Tax=Tenacibaculum sp. TaxID=1906242 RepID=UPI003AA871EE